MAVDEIIVAAAIGRAVAGFFTDGSLVRVEFAAVASDRRLGEIVLGRVQRAEAGLDAAFVDIGDGRSGFLNRADAGLWRRALAAKAKPSSSRSAARPRRRRRQS